MSLSVIEQRKGRPLLRHKERRQREKEEMRKMILEAGMDLVKHQGVSALTIRTLADHISYSTSIIYEYFKSKEEIFKALNVLLCQRLLETLNKVPQDTNPEHYLLHLVKVNVNFFERNHNLIELLSLECFGKDISQKPKEFLMIRELFGEALKKCHCKSLPTQADIDKALDVIRSLRVGMLILSQYETTHEGQHRISESLENGIKALLKGWKH